MSANVDLIEIFSSPLYSACSNIIGVKSLCLVKVTITDSTIYHRTCHFYMLHVMILLFILKYILMLLFKFILLSQILHLLKRKMFIVVIKIIFLHLKAMCGCCLYVLWSKSRIAWKQACKKAKILRTCVSLVMSLNYFKTFRKGIENVTLT